jgi:hypothetical protein
MEEDKDKERVDALFEKIDAENKIYSTEIEALKPEDRPVFNPEDYVTQDDFTYLKGQINNALEQLVELFVGLEDRFDLLDERIAQYNRKSSHKL